uniref:Uncharacterized protein n=1 Tax=Anguilla anguilla TaxID=7936 RepID=A0A0E9QHX7_ANGAN
MSSWQWCKSGLAAVTVTHSDHLSPCSEPEKRPAETLLTLEHRAGLHPKY